MMEVSLLFPAYNRLEFTRQSWAALMQNTDWDLVAEFHVYDDGSTDGTCEFLQQQVANFQPLAPTQIHLHQTSFRSPMGVTLDWIKRSRAPMLAKLDNDTVYPPCWLRLAIATMNRHPELDMLGLECMRRPVTYTGDGWLVPEAAECVVPGDQLHIARYDDKTLFGYGYIEAQFISGLGIYRRAAFDTLPTDNGYFGLEEWQQAQAHLKYGWILPSLPTILLDRLPFDPWKSLSELYVRKGWQREWSGAGPLRYKPEQEAIWSWWTRIP